MSVLLTVILSVSASPSSGTDYNAASAAFAVQSAPSGQTATPAPAARTGRELADAAHAALRKWAKATDQQAEAAARDLFGIYRELVQDTKLARSQRETLRITVRGRLDQLCTQITKRIAKDKIAKDKAAAKLAGKVDANKADANKADANVKSVAAATADKPLAQVGIGAGAGGMGAGAGGAGQNANDDAGQQLVDLIQNTIAPKSWDVNGGEGSIYYWKQQHAIVVHATGDVQDDISDALEQLDRASH